MVLAALPGLPAAIPAATHYALEQTHSLSPAAWSPIVTNLASSNGSLLFTNSPTDTSRFWRMRQVPQAAVARVPSTS